MYYSCLPGEYIYLYILRSSYLFSETSKDVLQSFLFLLFISTELGHKYPSFYLSNILLYLKANIHHFRLVLNFRHFHTNTVILLLEVLNTQETLIITIMIKMEKIK